MNMSLTWKTRKTQLRFGAIALVIALLFSTPTPAFAGPAFIPHPAHLWVLSTGRCLTVNSFSSSIWDKMYTSNCALGWQEQLWDVDPVGDGTYTVRSRYNQQCLDVYAYRQEDGAAVVTWQCLPGATNQHWWLEPNNFGNYNLRAVHSGKCLNAYSSLPWVVQWRCAGPYTSQAWGMIG